MRMEWQQQTAPKRDATEARAKAIGVPDAALRAFFAAIEEDWKDVEPLGVPRSQFDVDALNALADQVDSLAGTLRATKAKTLPVPGAVKFDTPFRIGLYGMTIVD